MECKEKFLFDGKIKVNEMGQIFSNSKGCWREIAVGNPSKYKTVSINKKRYYVHRLIAEAFLDNPLSKSDVNHINGDKHDNRVSNLEWVTHRENINHAYDIGLKKRKYPKTVSVRLSKLEDVCKQYGIPIEYFIEK